MGTKSVRTLTQLKDTNNPEPFIKNTDVSLTMCILLEASDDTSSHTYNGFKVSSYILTTSASTIWKYVLEQKLLQLDAGDKVKCIQFVELQVLQFL